MTDNQELTSKELDAHKGDDLSDKLRECPFCGESNSYVNKQENNNVDYYSIECVECGAQGSCTSDKKFVEELWNERAESQQLTVTQQKLDVAVEALNSIRKLPSIVTEWYKGLNKAVDISEAALNTIREKQ